jgi:hypothetical protein
MPPQRGLDPWRTRGAALFCSAAFLAGPLVLETGIMDRLFAPEPDCYRACLAAYKLDLHARLSHSFDLERGGTVVLGPIDTGVRAGSGVVATAAHRSVWTAPFTG